MQMLSNNDMGIGGGLDVGAFVKNTCIPTIWFKSCEQLLISLTPGTSMPQPLGALALST